MAFLKDITDKIVLGRWRFLNLKTISGTTKPLVIDEQGNLGTGSGGATTVTSANITDATATGRSVLTATDAAAARTAIGAGTSSLTIGTTASTAKAGNYVPTYAEITGKPSTFAPTIGVTATTAKAGNYTPTTTEVSNALKAKAEIAALSETSTLADIVAALKA